MQKTPHDFDARNQQKQQIEFGKKKLEVIPQKQPSTPKNIEVGQVRWYYEGMNIGHEQSKGVNSNFRRVGIILSNRVGKHLALIVPLTSKTHKASRYYLPLQKAEKFGLKLGSILLNQFRVIDRKRLIERVKLKKKLSKGFVQYIKQQCWKLVQ